VETNSLSWPKISRRSLVSACLSVCLYTLFLSAPPTWRILVKFDIANIHDNLLSSSKFGQNRTKISGILREELSVSYCGPRRMYCKKGDNTLLRFMATLSMLITSLTAIYVRQQYKWHSLLLFRSDSGYANAPLFYVIRTLPFLLFLLFVCCPCSSSGLLLRAWLRWRS
jgi:hypothetical protein